MWYHVSSDIIHASHGMCTQASRPPIQPVFPEEGDDSTNASTNQVVVVVPVVTQTSFQKKVCLIILY